MSRRYNIQCLIAAAIAAQLFGSANSLAQTNSPPVDDDSEEASSTFQFNGRISSSATVYTESATGQFAPGNELASPENLMFTDFRIHGTAAREDKQLKAVADLRLRFTPDELGARGYRGGSEYHLRRIYLEKSIDKLTVAVGRQLIGQADAIRIDGLTANLDNGGTWYYGAFAGAFPNPFSRSLDTDYAGTGSATRLPMAGGAHASYRSAATHGSLAAAVIVPRDAELISPDPTRVFLAANGYTRLSPDVDIIHYLVFDLAGQGGAQVLSAQGTVNWRPTNRLRVHLGASRMSTYAVEIYVRDLLETEDTQAGAGAPVQNNLALIRIANSEVRAGANRRIGDRMDVFAHLRARQRGALSATELPMEIAALEAENQLDVGGGVRKRDVFFRVELAARGALITGTRSQSIFSNLSARRHWLQNKLMSELVVGLVRYRDNCDDNNISCTGKSSGTTLRGGGTLIYRTRKLMFLGDYRISRLNSRVSGNLQPAITSHSMFFRAQYSF